MHPSTRRTLGLAAAVVLGGAAAIFSSPRTASAQYCENDICSQASQGYPECQPVWLAVNCRMMFDSRGNRYCSTSGCVEN